MQPNDEDNLRSLDLDALAAVDIRTVSPDDLVDIKDVVIDTALPKQERSASYIRQIRNPYCYKCGKMIVKVSFDKEGATLEEQLKTIFSTML